MGLKNKTTYFGIVCVLIVITIMLIVGLFILNNLKETLVYLECCNGNTCTDTYYTQEDNLCHLTMCENYPLFNNGNCTYEGVGIIINISNNYAAD